MEEYSFTSCVFSHNIQKSFDFTHNDLHTNNSMLCSTNQNIFNMFLMEKRISFLHLEKYTKIIDFGRAICKFNGRRICSDSFKKMVMHLTIQYRTIL